MSIQEIATVTACERVGAGLYSLSLALPGIARAARPGQFVHIACGEGNLLRRPISICTALGETLRVVFQVKGEGTKWLAARRTGDAVDVLGPLGHGYDMEKLGARPVLIGGGIGVPPMLMTMQAAKAVGADPAAILGFRSQDVVILEPDFQALGQTHVATDDGSYGHHGFVTDLLREQISAYTSVCACGPKGMLRGVAQLAKAAGLPCYVSLEERMGCGIGACLVCACALRGEHGETKYGHVCKNGPVFDAEEVEW